MEMLQYMTITKQLPRPDKVIWYERPFLKTMRQFAAGQGWLAKENNKRIRRFVCKEVAKFCVNFVGV